MNGWLCVKAFTGSGRDARTTYINIDKIYSIRESAGGDALISGVSDEKWFVKGSPEDIMEMIRGAQHKSVNISK